MARNVLSFVIVSVLFMLGLAITRPTEPASAAIPAKTPPPAPPASPLPTAPPDALNRVACTQDSDCAEYGQTLPASADVNTASSNLRPRCVEGACRAEAQ